MLVAGHSFTSLNYLDFPNYALKFCTLEYWCKHSHSRIILKELLELILLLSAKNSLRAERSM